MIFISNLWTIDKSFRKLHTFAKRSLNFFLEISVETLILFSCAPISLGSTDSSSHLGTASTFEFPCN